MRYLGLICATLLLKKSLSPFYITNLIDPGFPFTGLIEATHILPQEALGGRGLIYLPRYMAPQDSFGDNSDEKIMGIFLTGLKRIFPDFSEKDVMAQMLHREANVQPLQDAGYARNIPAMETPLKNLYLVNTTMIQDSTLNNNQVVGLAQKMARRVLEDVR